MTLSPPLFVIAVFAVLEGVAKDDLWFFAAYVTFFAAGYGALVLESWREV